MMSSKLLFTLIAVFFLQCTCASNKKWSQHEGEYQIEGNNMVVYDKALAKTFRTFLYATCDDSKLPNEMSCKLVLDKYMSLENERKNFTCDMKITAPKNREITRELKVEKFEVDSIFFSWREKEGSSSYSKYNFLHMPYCKLVSSGEVASPDDGSEKFIMYRNTFDVLDYSGKSCGSGVCRQSYTQTGKPFSNLEAFPDSFRAWSILPVAFDNPSEGFFALANKNETLWAVHVSESGSVSYLHAVPSGKFWYPRYAFERFGLCYSVETGKVRCSQVDFRLQTLMNTTVLLKKSFKVISLFNMNSGGMLLLTGQCEDESNVFSCTRLSAFKVQEDGRQEKPFDVPVPDFNCQPRAGTASVDIKQYGQTDCFLFAGICDGNDKSSSIKLSRRCIE